MTKFHLYFHTPVPIFKARVNMATVTYPLTQLTYDTVTLGAYTDIMPDMTLLLGSAEGLDDLGRTRAKKPATNSIIYIPRTSKGIEDGTLSASDNMYITILDDYRVWAKIPYFNTDNGIDFKDGDIQAGVYNTEIPPNSNCGPGFAAYIDPITELITVEFPGGGIDLSYAVAEGATISTYAWDVKDGTITVGTSASAVITATFPAGLRWVSLTVTDSNGRPHTSTCPVLAVDPDDDPTLQSYQVTQRLEITGQTLDIQLYEDAPRSTYPDGTLVLFWWDAPADESDRSHMKFIGWLDTERASTNRNQRGVVRNTTLHAVDVAGRLKVLPGFPQALERIESESPWSYMPDLDISKSLYYLLFWHTTATNLADLFLPPTGGSYDAMRLDSGASSLFNQVHDQAQKMVPDHWLACNSQGQLSVLRDWRLDDVGDRPTAAPIITEDNWNDLSYEYNRHPRVHVLRSGAIQSSTDWVVVDGEDTLPLVFSIAPGDAAAFGQGLQEVVESEGLALTQSDLNECEGHRYAMLNARYGDFNFKDPTASDFWDYEPALMNRVQLNIAAAWAAQRGLDFTQAAGLVKTIDVSYTATKRGAKVGVNVVWEREVSGFPASTYTPEDTEDVGYTPPPSQVPDFGLTPAQESVAGIGNDGYVYRTTDFQTPSGSGGPTWDRVNLSIAETIFSWVVDPFSPGYLTGTGSIDGWIATATDIYRVEDLFGTPTATSVHTFAASASWRSIQASFGTYFEEGSNPWLLCVSYYGSGGTKALRSVDGGTTWLGETVVSPHYNNSGSEPVLPIGIYASPKTPGLAYTVAYKETGVLVLADGYYSTDWGETWAALSGDPVDDPAEPLPAWGSWTHAGVYSYEGRGSSRSLTASSVSVNGPIVQDNPTLAIFPPANTKRLVVRCDWVTEHTSTGGGGSQGSGIILNDPSGINRTGNSNHTQPVENAGPLSDFFESTYDFPNYATQDWPNNRDSILSSPPSSPAGVRYLPNTGADSDVGQTRSAITTITLTVTEIELDDSTTYTPPLAGDGWLQPQHGFAGAVHLPWPTNDNEDVAYYGRLDRSAASLYSLIRSVAGVQTDISPLASAISYGVNAYGFTVRTYDSDRIYTAVAGVGNDAGTEKVGLWVSSDNGDTWTNILAPVAATNALYGLQIAFSGTDPDVLYTWGGYSNGSIPAISYSSDFGATLDSREGNMNSLGTVALVGIAGGPTP